MNFKSLIKNVALGTLLRKPRDDVESSSGVTQETFNNTIEDSIVLKQLNQNGLKNSGVEEGNTEINSHSDISSYEIVKQIVNTISDNAVDISNGEAVKTPLDNSSGPSVKSSAVTTGGLKLVPSSTLLSPSKGLLQQALESPQDEAGGSFVKKNSLLASLLVNTSCNDEGRAVPNEYVTNHPSASQATISKVAKPVSKPNMTLHALGKEQSMSDEGAQAFFNQVINSALSKSESNINSNNGNSNQHFKKPLTLAQGRPKSKGLPQARIAPSTPPLCSPTGSDNPEHNGQAHVPMNQCQPRHDQTKLLGVFNTHVSTPTLSSKPYIAIVFDKGTLFVPNSDNSGSEWRSKASQKVGHSFDLKLFRTNPARASYDTVELNLSFAIFTIEKPGSAAKVISDVELGSCFYLQATAVVRVDTFFIHDKGRRWILSAELVSDLCDSTNSDILCFLQRSTVVQQDSFIEESIEESIVEEPELIPVPAIQPSTLPSVMLLPKLVEVELPNISARPSVSSVNVPVLSAPSLSLPASPIISKPTASSLLTSVQDVKYPALTVLQSLHCTNCPNCKRKFKYTIEYLFHFVFQKSCQRALVNGKCEKALFYQKISQAISSKVKVPQQKLVCVKNVGVQKTCGFQSKTVLQYCMHNDKHVPDNNEIFPCYFCAGIYFSPFSFYRHKCLVQLKNIQNRKSSTPNSLFSIYSAIPLEVQTKILTCPSCSKRYEYIAGLLNHLKKTNSKCLNLLTKCYSKYITKDKYFDVAEMISSESKIEMVSLQCEVCLEVVANQVSYCMHKDHHEVGGDSKFVCKECSTQFNSPCSFYRHSCRSPDINWCALCEKVEPSSGFKKNVEEIVIEDEEVKVKQEPKDFEAIAIKKIGFVGYELNRSANSHEENMSVPRIVSTSGSVQFSPTTSTQIQFSPSDSESSIDTPRSLTEDDVTMDTSSELLMAETILADNPPDNQKKRKNSTEEGNLPKKRCNLKKRGISKEFDENFVETKPIILNISKENKPKKLIDTVCKANEVQVDLQTNQNTLIPEVKTEIEETKFEFDYWDCYLCTDCDPLKMLGGADGLVNHCREEDNHKDIRPLWTFNQCEVKVADLRKSYKYGVLVREKEREYLEYKKFGGCVGLLYSTFHQGGEATQGGEVAQECEVPKLKLKIGKGANGKFSVLS